MNLRKLAKASNDAQKQAARKSKEGKEEDIKDIKVDSNVFIHFYNWSKQVFACYLLHYMLFASTAICRLACTRGDLLPLNSDSDCKKVRLKSINRRRKENIMPASNLLAHTVRCVDRQ